MTRAVPLKFRLAAFIVASTLATAIGAQGKPSAQVGVPAVASAELVSPVAVAELEAGLRALVAPRDQAKADAAAAALKTARLGLGSAERRLAAFWRAWFESGSDFDAGFDHGAFQAAYEAVKSAEAAALGAASAFIAEAKKARAYAERSTKLLLAYDASVAMDPAWRIGEDALAALKQAAVDELIAAALGPGPASYLAASRERLGGAPGGREALASFAAAWGSATEEGLFTAAVGLARAYGAAARFVSHCALRGDAFGYLAVRLSLMRELDFINLARSSGLGEPELRALADAAPPATPPAVRAPGEDELEPALGLYAAWLSASLRALSDEPAAFARLSASYGADEALNAPLGPAGSAARSRLGSRRDGYWLRAQEALTSDLRAELLAWLRSSGYAASTPQLSLTLRCLPLAGASLGAAVDLELLVDGARYYPPYGALKASMEASLRTVFGGELPAYAYVERVDALRYAYRGAADLALRAELLDPWPGETGPGSDAVRDAGAAAAPSRRLAPWMASRLGEAAVAALARSYAAAEDAALRKEGSR